MKRYNIIYADPPWWENSPAIHTSRPKFDRKIMYAGRDFPLMRTERIISLPIKELTASNCALFLWSTSRHIPDALKVTDGWGFRFVKIVFTWMKINRDGKPTKSIGYYTKSNSEYVLLGIKGRMPPINFSVGEAVLESRDRVFKKPNTIRNRIVELYGEGTPRIELFARDTTEGWDVWGNQTNNSIIIP